ncbi:MAG: Ger(x)C family spore germination protein [Firmicutes bacterium]|nr:Ger(x)C family spore germination protein [Bacillota bacterium]
MSLLKHARLGLIFSLMLLCLSGCWDVIPIEDRAQVLVIGVDRNEGRIRLSAQIPTIKNLIQTVSPFTDRKKPIFKPFVVEGKSLIETMQRLEDRIFQSMVVGNVKLIIISPQAAEDDLLNILTIFLRQPTLSYQTLVMCSENSAAEIVRFEAPFELQPGLMIGKQQASPLKLTRSFPIKLWELVARIDNGITDPYLPVIKPDRDNQSYIIEGLKLFRRDKIVASLNPDESYLFGVLTGKVEEGYKEITVQNQEVGFSKVRYKTRIRIIRNRNHDRIQVEIKASGTLLQIPKGFPNRVATYKSIKTEMEKQLKRQILALVKKMQLQNTDPVGFRKRMEIAGIKDWEKVYPLIPVDIKVRFKFRNLSPAY